MRHRIRCLTLFVLAALAFAGPSRAAPRKPITRVHVVKSKHVLELLSGEEVVATYPAQMGMGGAGPKIREGDTKTPVGRYHIVSRQPSEYRLFLRLDYPNAEDRARFARMKKSGELPPSAKIGGDIGIHGPPIGLTKGFAEEVLVKDDWTVGCVGVSDRAIQEIAARVPIGTIVDIED